MLIPKTNRREVYKYLFRGKQTIAALAQDPDACAYPTAEGVLYAEKDFNLEKHPEMEGIPNLQVLKLMQSFKSQEFVTERYSWRYYYWFLTDKGIEYLREYLNLPSEIVPNTLKKSTRPLERTAGPQRPDRGDRPPRRFEGGAGGREGYRSGAPREGGFGRGGDKAGAPGDYQPRFGGAGRGAPPAQ